MEGDDVGLAQQILAGGAAANFVGGSEGVVPKDVVADQRHAKSGSAEGDLFSDMAQTDDAQRLAVQFAAGLPLPLAMLDGIHVEPERLGHRDHQAEGVLGDGGFVDAGREENRNSFGGGVLDVDGIQADAVLGDDAQSRQSRVDDAGGDLVVAVEQPVNAPAGGDKFEHFGFAERPACADDFEAALGKNVVMLAGGVLETRGGK